jgi:hypothetical protein
LIAVWGPQIFQAGVTFGQRHPMFGLAVMLGICAASVAWFLWGAR